MAEISAISKFLADISAILNVLAEFYSLNYCLVKIKINLARFIFKLAYISDQQLGKSDFDALQLLKQNSQVKIDLKSFTQIPSKLSTNSLQTFQNDILEASRTQVSVFIKLSSASDLRKMIQFPVFK